MFDKLLFPRNIGLTPSQYRKRAQCWYNSGFRGRIRNVRHVSPSSLWAARNRFLKIAARVGT